MTNEDNKNMTIIGASRGLGKWIAQHLKEDFNITITSRNQAEGQEVANELKVSYNNDNIDAIKDANIIIFSVPIEHMATTIKEVAPHAPKGSLLMDVASIKKEPAEALEKYAPKDVEILPCHPMFGPRVPTLKRQIVVLTPIENRSNSWTLVKEYLEKKECEIVITSPDEHDKYMSIVQGLTHFSFISLASTIKKLNINVKKSRSFSSPVYSLMLDMISRVVYQNPYLYYSIQKNNKETAYARDALIKESMRLSKLIEEGDEEDFVKAIAESAEHIDEIEEALVRSDKAISMLNQKANILTKLIGEEVGLEDAFSKKAYMGIVRKVSSQTVTIENENNEEIELKISSIDIMDKDELFQWKKKNLKLESFDLTAKFPSSANEDYLLKMFKRIEPVIDANIIFKDKEIEKDLRTYKFHYSLFNKQEKDYVEKYIQGIGGILIK